MVAKRVSRGRGPRITEAELEKILSLYLEGKTFKAIAKETKRHWQTVRKYALKALQEREGRDLRREALKEALVDHFKDLVEALGSIDGLLVMPGYELTHGWRPMIPELRNRLLIVGLKDYHARESPLWSWWDSWNAARENYEANASALQKRMSEHLALLEKSRPGVSLMNEMGKVVLQRAIAFAHGSSIYDPSMLRVRPPAGKKTEMDGEELWLGEFTQLATGRGMDGLREEISRLMGDVGEWEETEETQRLYRQMAETKGKIEEEVAVLALRRAFPGRCRLCPV